jgi:hypothetical protein
VARLWRAQTIVGDEVDVRAISDRVRILIGDDTISRTDLARRLRVSESAVRAAIDQTSPHPTLDLLAAIVREYGVDPSWLVFGEYDAAIHRASLEAASRFTARDLVDLASGKVRRGELPPALLRSDPPGEAR